MQLLNYQQVTPLELLPWGVVGLAYFYAPRLSPTPKVLNINTLQALYSLLGLRDLETVYKVCIYTQPETAKNATKGVYFRISLGDFKPHAPRLQL